MRLKVSGLFFCYIYFLSHQKTQEHEKANAKEEDCKRCTSIVVCIMEW